MFYRIGASRYKRVKNIHFMFYRPRSISI